MPLSCIECDMTSCVLRHDSCMYVMQSRVDTCMYKMQSRVYTCACMYVMQSRWLVCIQDMSHVCMRYASSLMITNESYHERVIWHLRRPFVGRIDRCNVADDSCVTSNAAESYLIYMHYKQYERVMSHRWILCDEQCCRWIWSCVRKRIAYRHDSCLEYKRVMSLCLEALRGVEWHTCVG